MRDGPRDGGAGEIGERDGSATDRSRAAGWYRATTLSERAASLSMGRAADSGTAFDGALAERRLQRWRSQTPFGDDELFASRLSLDHLDESAFRSLLGESPAAVQRRVTDTPAWLTTFRRAFSRAMPASASTGAALPELQGEADFLVAVEPSIADGQRRLRDALQSVVADRTDLPFDADTAPAILLESLTARLIPLLSRTMVMELNVARVEGRLTEASAEARYRSFLRSLERRDVLLALYEEYPVLARRLTTTVDQWVESSLGFLRDLADDWDAIRRQLAPDGEPGTLVAFDAGKGDAHHGGRSVAIVTFNSGLSIVYKPKPLATAVHFGELLEWLNRRGAAPDFRSLNVLDRGDHGWVELVEVRECASEDEVRRFYQRQGGYLAMLYAIGATDFHYENLLAAGEHPVLIDLEGLFHPRIAADDAGGAADLADESLNESVLGVGLLPQLSWANDDSDGIDVSGLGARSGQTIPGGVTRLEGAGTDEARYAQSDGTLPRGRHRPRLNGADADPLDYVDEIVAGFTATYRLLERHRDDLLADDGPLARFANDLIRVLVRPTQIYFTLLQASHHPRVLRDALDRDRLLDRLWVGVQRRPRLAALVAAERKDLEVGDIPLFTSYLGSDQVWTSRGERLGGLVDETGLSRARQHIQRLGDADLAHQTWIIRASLATVSSGRPWARQVVSPGSVQAGPPDSSRLLLAARAIGDRLEQLAVRSADGSVSWVGLTITPRQNWVLAPSWLDLYDGLPGIALFLAYLGAATGERRYTRLAEASLPTIRRLLERDGDAFEEVGAFSGWGGLIYAYTHLAALWQRPELLAGAEGLVERLPARIERDARFDLVFGAAGGIASLLVLHELAPADRLLQIAAACGERLLAQARPMEHGVGWTVSPKFAVPLAGFSHGAAGIAWALLRLAERTGDPRFRRTALDAVAYERSLFSDERGNWPDLREYHPTNEHGEAQCEAHTPPFTTAWCHGAPGIGLARLSALGLLDDDETRAEIATALATTAAYEYSQSHSLCHGSLGNLELLLQAGEHLGSDRWRTEAFRLAATILEGAEQEGWRCGTPLGVESPGLMTGLAGIGYGLLRLAAPAAIPSVLALEPPRRTGAQVRALTSGSASAVRSASDRR